MDALVCMSQTAPAKTAKTAEEHKSKHLCLGVVHELLVSEVWVHLHLDGSWLDASISQQVIHLLAAEVGNANGLDKTIVY